MVVLVGNAQTLENGLVCDEAPSPQDRLSNVVGKALDDCSAKHAIHVDVLAVVRTFPDSSPAYQSTFGRCDNYPAAVARHLGLSPERLIYTAIGGNTPQALVNHFAGEITAGRSRCVVLAGVEALRTARLAKKQALALDWSETTGQMPEAWGDMRMGVSQMEMRAGLMAPTDIYPLFETSLMHQAGHSPAEHARAMGTLMADFARVAAKNPYATDRTPYSAEEIATPGPDNRLITWPYTKRMNANDRVDQAAAVLLMAKDYADELGIASERCIYLHGGADLTDQWFVTERADFTQSPAIKAAAQAALKQAGRRLEDMALFDIYSCFPSAVSIACDALGLATDDPRGLTVTGGLPFFGGPGNNYSLHAIAEMADRLRERPEDFGLVTANGWYLTKHSLGIYGARPPENAYKPVDLSAAQARIDAVKGPPMTDEPGASGVLETYAIRHNHDGPQTGFAIVRAEDGAWRALTHLDVTTPGLVAHMTTACQVGDRVDIRQQGARLYALP